MKKLSVKDWLSKPELDRWVRAARTPRDFERRIAIRLIALGYSCREISRILVVSESSIQRWINLFNSTGPQGMTPGARGGRRRSLLPIEQEKQLMEIWMQSQSANVKTLLNMVTRASGRQASLKYAYDLVRRYGGIPQNDGKK